MPDTNHNMSHCNNTHAHQHRTNPKNKSIQANSQQWKDSLRRDCMRRAKLARRERLTRQRSSCGHDFIDVHQGTKRDRHEGFSDINESDGYAFETNFNHSDAKALVEQELQKSMMGLRHCHQIRPLHEDESASKRRTGANQIDGYKNSVIDVNMGDGMGMYLDSGKECKMSHEEYLELINAVTEELEREDEMLEEEIWEIERLEALEREKLLHDIDDFESWEEEQMKQQFKQNNQQLQYTLYTSPFSNASSPRVTCPICTSKSLIQTPFEGIQCTNNINESSHSHYCNFQLDIAHEGLTLQHLQTQLAMVYEEHSRECHRGVLRFRMVERGGMKMLMAGCEECDLDLVVL